MKVSQKQKEKLKARGIERVGIKITAASGKQIELENLEDLLLHIEDIRRIAFSYELKNGSTEGYGLTYPCKD